MTEPKKVTTKTQEPGLVLSSLNTPEAQLPAVVQPTDIAATGAQTPRKSGLTYQNATPEEREQMDALIAGIDLTDPETVVSLGAQERQKLADLADQMLDSFNPDVKLAFAEALSSLVSSLKGNSLENVKQRSAIGAFTKLFKVCYCVLTGKDYRVELGKDLVKNFMNDVTGSRQIIREVTDTLVEQSKELNKNFNRINQFGFAITQAAQQMRIVHAATEEYIRRVEAGEITTLADLETRAQQSGRPDDAETLQLAHATWNNLRVIDGDLLGSIGVYDMNIANLAFTRQANIQNRMKTATALTSTTAEWKSQLLVFATVLTERTAQQVLGNIRELTTKSVKANRDLFDTLVDETIATAAQGTYSLRTIAEQQNAMATKLESVGPEIERQFNELAADKETLKASIAEFRERAATVYSKKAGLLSTGPASPQP